MKNIIMVLFLMFLHAALLTSPTTLSRPVLCFTEAFSSTINIHEIMKTRFPAYFVQNSNKRQVGQRIPNIFQATQHHHHDVDGNIRKDQIDAVKQFIHQITTSLNQDLILRDSIPNVDTSYTFQTLTLLGPKALKKKKKSKTLSNGVTDEQYLNDIESQQDKLRGCIREVKVRYILLQNKKSKKNKSKTSRGISHDENQQNEGGDSSLFLQSTFKYHSATDIAQNWLLASKVDIENIENNIWKLLLPGYEQNIECQDKNEQKQQVGNAAISKEWNNKDSANLPLELGIQSAELMTTNGTWLLDMAIHTTPAPSPSLKTNSKPKSSKFKNASCKKKKTTKRDCDDNDNTVDQSETSLYLLQHDIPKNAPISPSSLFLQKLGVSNVDGKPKVGMASKLRQCQKFVEVISGLVNQISLTSQSFLSTSSEKPTLRTIDMGCGRGYLTFSLHSFLQNQYSTSYDIQTLGIDMRPKLVREINEIAKELGGEFHGLKFVEGKIQNTMMMTSDDISDDDKVDILVALHACDTATDDSIFYGIEKGAQIIVTSPCCHKEVRFSLDPHVQNMKTSGHPLADILQHNIYKERMAETITDTIRGLLLEIANYDVQVFEFIGGEHTSKNVMITAVKRAAPRSDSETKRLRERLISLSTLFGIKRQKLADRMKELLVKVEEDHDIIPTKSTRKRSTRSIKMPPLR